MTDPQRHTKKPTSKQLRYLRSLAERCGESFAYPASAAEASRGDQAAEGPQAQPESGAPA